MAAPSSAWAQEDDGPSFDQKIIQNVLGAVGLRGGGDIDYRERSPLVLPPSLNLPPPQNDATAGAPNWPVDADQKRRKQEANRQRDEVEESRALRPSELNVGQRKRSQTGLAQDHPDGKPVGPSELGYKGGLFGSLFNWKSEPTATFTGEPPRTSLTAPPVGYQTPSPDQPYGPGNRREEQKARTHYDHGTFQK
jgi:hypothetical protein